MITLPWDCAQGAGEDTTHRYVYWIRKDRIQGTSPFLDRQGGTSNCHQQLIPCSRQPIAVITSKTATEMSFPCIIRRRKAKYTHWTRPQRSAISVLQIATAMIFNGAAWDYQPVTLPLDSGAQKNLIKSGTSEDLNLRITGPTSFTTSGMGEIQQVFNSNEAQITWNGINSSKKLENLPVHTKEKLTTSLTTAELSEADLNFISTSDIVVAQQTLARTSVSPDILIGQDPLNTVIDYGNPVLTLPSGLILTPTVFGYTIFGTNLITTKPAAAEIHLSKLVIFTPIGDCRKTNQIREDTVTPRLFVSGNSNKQKDNFDVAHHSKSGGSALFDGGEEDQDCRVTPELLPSLGSRLSLSELKKLAKKLKTIWNHDYLRSRDHRRLLGDYKNPRSRYKVVLPDADKGLRKKAPKKRVGGSKRTLETMKKPDENFHCLVQHQMRKQNFCDHTNFILCSTRTSLHQLLRMQ
ncbi:hypothetical protein Y032_0028g1648 [Ancylostoma ceylanicum]|uniref:DUF1758 domain-containing protein n=1 Tax=Ancylostoma ceylanicum TaxID=53326 RepID=A0A016USZ8_9BILA|nr:hypothetical protein Y032_0028g1648 [Ancylostoma ceylanicum]